MDDQCFDLFFTSPLIDNFSNDCVLIQIKLKLYEYGKFFEKVFPKLIISRFTVTFLLQWKLVGK